MSRRLRTPLATGTAAAALASGAAPAGTAPTVPDTVPLASDQISAPQAPVAPIVDDGTVPASVALGGVSGQAVVGVDPLDGSIPEAVVPPTAPTPVPDHVPLDELVAPADADVDTNVKAPLVHVDGTVPLPADQMTPLVPVTRDDDVRGESSFASVLNRNVGTVGRRGDELHDGAKPLFTDADDVITAIRGGKVPADMLAAWKGELADVDRLAEEMAALGWAGEPRRAFPVLFDVEHDGVRYYPGGLRVEVTFDEWANLKRGTAIALDWREGGDVPA